MWKENSDRSGGRRERKRGAEIVRERERERERERGRERERQTETETYRQADRESGDVIGSTFV